MPKNLYNSILFKKLNYSKTDRKLLLKMLHYNNHLSTSLNKKLKVPEKIEVELKMFE